jgi:hypothetical protein
MKKTMLWAPVILAIGVFGSCTFKGTGTIHVSNFTSHTITAVDFLAVVGGTTQNCSVSIGPGDGNYFYRIEPGTYDIQVTVSDGVGTFIAFNDFLVEESVIHFQDLEDVELPCP